MPTSPRISFQDRADALTPLERARAEQIVRDHEPLVLWAVGQFARLAPESELEEIAQEFRLVLWRAAFTWDYRKAKLSTYVVRMMRQRALNMHTKHNPSGVRLTPDKMWRALSLDWPSEDTENLIDRVHGEDQISIFEDEQHVAWIRAQLDERERAMVDDQVQGLTYQEIGDKHGVTRERVRQIVKDAGKRLTDELAG